MEGDQGNIHSLRIGFFRVRLSTADLIAATAPLVIALAAMMYFAGFMYKQTLLREFGLSAFGLSDNIQQTMSVGYIPTLIAILVTGLLYFVAHRTVALIESAIRRRQLHATAVDGAILNKIAQHLLTFSRYAGNQLFAQSFMFGLISSGVVAVALANRSADRTHSQVADACKSGCYIFGVKGIGRVGILLAQDTDKMLIYTAAGVRILRTADVEMVRPYTAKAHAHCLYRSGVSTPRVRCAGSDGDRKKPQTSA